MAAAKIWVKVIGTLAGVLGATIVLMTAFVFWRSILDREAVRSFFVFYLVNFIIGCYFVYVGFLVWRRFSPRAVRHVCGTVGFFLLGFLIPDLGTEAVEMVLGVLAFIAVIAGYSFATRRLNEILFSSEV